MYDFNVKKISILDDILINMTIHTIKKIKPIGFQNLKDPKFKIDDIVRISKYKNTFAKGYIPNWKRFMKTNYKRQIEKD